MKSSIGTKISFAFLMILITMGFIAGVSFYSFNGVSESVKRLKIEAVKRGVAGNLRYNSVLLSKTFHDYMHTPNKESVNDFKRLNEEVEKHFAQLSNLDKTESEADYFQQIRTVLDEMVLLFQNITKNKSLTISKLESEQIYNIEYGFSSNINSITTKIYDGISARIDFLLKQTDEIHTSAENKIIYSIIFGLSLGAFFTYIAIQRISKPIKTVTLAAKKIAQGDYSSRPHVSTHDEVAVLANAFEHMAKSIDKSQTDLLESKRVTESIVATLPIGLVVYSSNNTVKAVNNEFCKIFNTEKDIITNECFELFLNEIKIQDNCRKRILEHKPFMNQECKLIDENKGTLNLNLTLVPIRITNGESLLIIEDVTKRKHDAQLAAESEKHFKSLIENSSDGLMVISPNGAVLYESPVNSRINGFEFGELLNKNAFTIIHPDDMADVQKLLSYILEKPDNSIEHELRFKRKDGVWRWAKVVAKNALDNQTIRGIVVNFRDITEEKLLQEAIKQSEEQYRTLFEMSPVGIAITTEQGRILLVNSKVEEILGYTKDELENKIKAEQLYQNPNDRKKILEEFKQKGFLSHHIYQLVDKNGNVKDLIFSMSQIKYRNEPCLLTIFEDVSKLKRTELALKDSQQKFHIALMNSSIIIAICDKDARYKWIHNPHPDFDPNSVIGKTDIEIIDNESTRKLYELKKKVLKTKTGAREEILFSLSNGITCYDIKVEPIFDESGELTGCSSSALDITEIYYANELLKQSEEDLKRAQSVAKVGNWNINFENDEVTWSEESFNIFGLEINTPPKFEKFLTLVHPEDIPDMKMTWGAALINGRYDIEYRIIVDEKIKWIRSRAEFLRDNEGKIIRAFGINQDITESKIAEKQIYALIDAIPEGLIVSDKNGDIILVNDNAPKLFGYSKAELKMENIDSLIPEKYREKHKRLISDYFSNPRIRQMGSGIDIYALRKDGSKFPADISFNTYDTTEGKAVISVVRDITEQKKTQEEIIKAKESAEEMNRLKSIFLANMSHELRTPMIGVLGAIEFLKDELKDPDSLEMIDMMHDSSKRLLDTLNQILDLSYIESGLENIYPQNVDLISLCENILKLFENNISKKGLTVKTNFCKECIINTDNRMMSSVINNLISNAIKYTDKGTIKVSVRLQEIKRKKFAKLQIEDTGIGIKKENLKFIFDEFRQESEGFSRNYQGAGLGLAIVKKYVEKLNGKIEVKSEVGAGSKFTIILPVE